MKLLAESGHKQWSLLMEDHIQLFFVVYISFFFFKSKWFRYFQVQSLRERNCADLFFEVRLKKGQGESLLKCGCLPSFLKMCCLCVQCLPRNLSASCVFQSTVHTLLLHLISIFGQLHLTFSLLLANIWEFHQYSPSVPFSYWFQHSGCWDSWTPVLLMAQVGWHLEPMWWILGQELDSCCLSSTFFFKSRPLKPFHTNLKEHEYCNAKHSMGVLLLCGGIFSMWSISRSSAKWLLPGVPKRQPVQGLCFVGQQILLIASFTATDWSLQPLAGFTCWSCRQSDHWSQWKQGDQLGTRKFFWLLRQNFAPMTVSHFQAPAGSELCFSWTDSYLTIASNYASNSEAENLTSFLRYTSQLYPGCTSRWGCGICWFSPYFAFIWKECVQLKKELFCILSNSHLNNERSRP